MIEDYVTCVYMLTQIHTFQFTVGVGEGIRRISMRMSELCELLCVWECMRVLMCLEFLPFMGCIVKCGGLRARGLLVAAMYNVYVSVCVLVCV